MPLREYPDHLATLQYSAIGDTPVLVLDLDQPEASIRAREHQGFGKAVIIGVDRRGCAPLVDAGAFDVLLSANTGAVWPYVGLAPDRLDMCVSGIVGAVRSSPIAATTLCRILRMGETMSLADALWLESAAYSLLLGGVEFRRWAASSPTRPPLEKLCKPPVDISRDGNRITISLNDPGRRNALSARMRDALFEALANAIDDPTRPSVILCGAGACFSVGGDLSEFGQSDDLAFAHVVRTQRSCSELLAELGPRAEVRLHGACIGAGIEVAAAAFNRYAMPGTFIHLPEVSMGLIPGAGGTATLPPVIGRHRTAYLALRGRRVPIESIANWGLATIRETGND
jgi:hypothetical protein